MKKIIPIIVQVTFLLHMCLTGVYGQNVIRGRVLERGSNEPVIGGTVVEFDANDRIIKGTITDVNGNYVLSLTSSAARLQFSYIGFKSQTVEVAGKTIIDITLEPVAMDIEEVVITAQAADTNPLTGVSLRDRTGASVRVDMEGLKNMSGLSVDDALQGQITGLDIMGGGAPGSGSSIVIRGLGSLANSKPLIVVNGIEQQISIGDDFDFASSDQEDIGQLLNIAPQDIKSIEVLKDASTTAQWGSKGADGVLLIETHRGVRGKTVFNYNYKFTLTEQPPPIPMLNGDEYITMQLEQLHNAQGIFDVPDEIAYNPDFFDFYNYSANTDWIKAITQSGMNHDHYFKFSGGGDKTAFFASLNATQERGTTLNEAFKRLSTRINLDYTLSSKIRFSVNFDYTNSYRNGNYVLRGTFFDEENEQNINIRQMAYMKAPNMSIMEYDQLGSLTGEYFTPINSYQGSGLEYFNPVAIAHLSRNDVGNNIFQNSYVLNYRVSKWLRFIETVSFQYTNLKSIGFLPHAAVGIDWLQARNNESRERNTNNNRISSRTQLIFTPIVGLKHNLTGSLMSEISQNAGQWSQVTTRNGPSMSIFDPSLGSHITQLSSSYAESRTFGNLASFTYKFRDKYIATAGVRADASSKFGLNNRWGFFPNVSFGWRFTNEDFFSDLEFLNDGKLTFSYGKAGKEPNNAYDRFGLFVNANPNQYIYNSAIIPSQIDLTNLKWQNMESFNVGIELSMINNRLYVSGDIYDKTTSDILWNRYDIPSSSGFNRLLWYNGGEIRNYGWEGSARYNFLKRDKLSLTANFNISRNINSFTAFPENFNNIVGASIGNATYPRMAQVGQPVGSFYGFRYLGVYSTSDEAYAKDINGNWLLDAEGVRIPMRYTNGYRFAGGDAIYDDVNNDGLIDLQDVVYLGDSNPKYTGGFGLNASYGQFSMNCMFMYRAGFDIVNLIAIRTEGMRDKNNQSMAVLRRWRNEGDNYTGMLPRAYLDHPANNLGSDRYVEKGDFLRLNNLNFTYRVKRSALRNTPLDNIDVGMNMRKIWTLTNYTGQDPEIRQNVENPFWFGTDNGQTPSPSVYSFYLNIIF